MELTLSTTPNLLMDAHACETRYMHLRIALKKEGLEFRPNTDITIEQILDLNGLDDALFALRAVPENQVPARDKLTRLFACDCVQVVLPIYEQRIPKDARPRMAIEAARLFALGFGSVKEMAFSGGRPLTRVRRHNTATRAVWDAARATTWAAAWSAAFSAASDSAWASWAVMFDRTTPWSVRAAAWAAWTSRTVANTQDSPFIFQIEQAKLLRSYLRGDVGNLVTSKPRDRSLRREITW